MKKVVLIFVVLALALVVHSARADQSTGQKCPEVSRPNWSGKYNQCIPECQPEKVYDPQNDTCVPKENKDKPS